MNDSFKIHTMYWDDLAFAAQCTAAEGWASEDLSALQGFYLAEVDGQPAGICVATLYGGSGFIGELIVRPEQRGGGMGAALLNHGVRLLQQGGAHTVYLDGVLKAVGLYERKGFRKVARSWRFSGRLAGKVYPDVRPIRADDLPAIFDLDRLAFREDRTFFLGRRWSLFPELGKVWEKDGRVVGYILGRRGTGWVSAGPWVITPGENTPERLLESLALETGTTSISIGILDTHSHACTLARSLGLTAREDSPWRMALGRQADLGTSLMCYAVGSAAKG